MTAEKITEEQFRSFEDVRKSGKYNMFDVTSASADACLDRDTYVCIMQNYDDLRSYFYYDRG
jgi:hypothetical protein